MAGWDQVVNSYRYSSASFFVREGAGEDGHDNQVRLLTRFLVVLFWGGRKEDSHGSSGGDLDWALGSPLLWKGGGRMAMTTWAETSWILVFLYCRFFTVFGFLLMGWGARGSLDTWEEPAVKLQLLTATAWLEWWLVGFKIDLILLLLRSRQNSAIAAAVIGG